MKKQYLCTLISSPEKHLNSTPTWIGAVSRTRGTFIGVMEKGSRPYMNIGQIDVEILESLDIVLFYLKQPIMPQFH